ncbi:MAG: tetratricopeptide repeat protein, partial [Bacteroidota bacterium]
TNYLVKLVFPFELVPMYPYPKTIPWYFYASGLILPLYLFGLYKSLKSDNKVMVFGLLFFVFNIILLLQVLGAGQGFLADRFTYVAYFGLFFIVAYYGAQFYKSKDWKKFLSYGIGIGILIFSAMSFQQNKIWENGGTLWSHVLKHYNKATLPYGLRGNYYRDIGDPQKAMQDYNRALKLEETAETLNSRGKLYFSANNDPLALKDYKKATELDPTVGEYFINLGACFARMGNLNQALQVINRGLALEPTNANGYLNRSIINESMRNYEATLQDIDAYIGLNPTNPDMFYERGRLKRILKRNEAALKDLNIAISMNPSQAFYFEERANIYIQLNRNQEAIADQQRARSMQK